jgi:hypothetical protein
MLSQPYPLKRRRSSKGTIAGFAQGKAGGGDGEMVGGDNNTDDDEQANQAQHASDSSGSAAPPAKPCVSARLALMTCQNAIHMGARTQLALCPPGRARRSLQQALRSKARSGESSASQKGESELGGYFGLDKMLGVQALAEHDEQEEDFLLSTNTFEGESDEEASSGDEDELNNIDDLLDDESPIIDDDSKYLELREPLFMPSTGDPSLTNPKGTPSMGSGSTGKLPFNRRKIHYFDSVTASERADAREYLKEETLRCKKRNSVLLTRHLRRMQRRERRRTQIERGETPDFENSDEEEEDPAEQELLSSGVSKFPHPMNGPLSAALVLESLSMNPLESVEGMSKCYDGIVAAGIALLESQLADDDKPRPTRSEIVAALAPLLITSLEQASGEVVLQLARLRRMCGTHRYQRRFVQRVAPCLVRPPQAAMWCLRHQNDIEPILAATELIFDSAFDIFSKGWYDRGQLLLADSARRETLKNAAQQLKNLSSDQDDEVLSLQLGTSSSHGLRRGSKLIKGGKGAKDAARGGSEPLAEWEVIAVDRQIRISISNIMSQDWARVMVMAREGDGSSKAGYRRHTPSPGISSRTRNSVSESPRGISSPRSPPRPADTSAMIRPSRSPGEPVPSIEAVFGPSFASQPVSEAAGARTLSPLHADAAPPPPGMPVSPPMQRRHSLESGEEQSKTLNRDPFTPNTLPRSPIQHRPENINEAPSSLSVKTPPRSPQDDDETAADTSSSQDAAAQASPGIPASPRLSRSPIPEQTVIISPPPDRGDRAPLSPGPASAHSGVTGSLDVVAYTSRPVSSASSVASTGSSVVSRSSLSQPAHYRMLTSTAAERKRTVAACRALRAQISRFEEAFMQLHGRPPRGAAERAPLATTYAQYREWKRAIRADAASRIQALFRGARTRWMLLRMNDPKITAVVRKKAGRPRTPNTLQDRLGIPTDIGPVDSERTGLALAPMPPAPGPSGVEVFVNNPYPVQSKRQIASADGISPVGPGPVAFASGSGSRSPTAAVAGLNHLSLPELQSRKRDLKQQLKQYDMDFARQHGRMPVKAEKEPIRHLYETYNALKAQITLLEKEGQPVPSPNMQPTLSQRSPSPPPSTVNVVTDSGSENSPLQGSTTSQRMSSSSRSSKRKSSKSPPMPAEASTPAVASTPTGAPSQDLAALKDEKGKLHQMLRSYEKDFYKEHNRQVSSFADIRPVASQYRRYKEIKKAIAQLQESGLNK